jgi:hypothetical protein
MDFRLSSDLWNLRTAANYLENGVKSSFGDPGLVNVPLPRPKFVEFTSLLQVALNLLDMRTT